MSQPQAETALIQIPKTSSLPMSDMVQSALLGHLILDDKIFMQVARRIQPSWFLNVWHSKIYALLVQCYQRIGRPPNRAELENFKEILNEDMATKQKLLVLIGKACSDASQIRWDAIRPDLTEWLQSKILQETILKSSQFWNRANWQQAARLMQTAVQQYKDASFDEGIEVQFDDPETWLAKQIDERSDALTTGLKMLDESLLDGAISGGLQRGDTTVVLAPSNVGKTTSLLTIARHNIFANKDVLLMTHEGRPEDIRNKLMKACLDCSEDEMLRLYATPEGLERLKSMSSLLKQKLTYIPYNKAGMKVEDVVPIIRRAQEERKAKVGKGYDLLVVDYPAKLTTEQARGSLAVRNVLEIVYDFYVQLALEYKFHSLLAIQTNREGSKVNNGQNTNRLLTMEDVMEAWGPMTSASNVITLNRSPAAKRNNRITYYVAKSRSSEVGRAIVARSNFSHGLTHSQPMGSTGYFGTTTMELQIDAFLQSHNGQMIPQNLVR